MSARPDPLTHRDVAVDGERLHVRVSAGAGVPLLICSDFVANLELLDDLVAALERPVICFDLPGVGASARLVRMRRMPGLAALLAELMTTLGHAEFDLLGMGWGGLLAQRLARDQPRRVRRLVLVATSTGQIMLPGRLASLRRMARPSGLKGIVVDARDARELFGGRRRDECAAIVKAMAQATAPTWRGYLAQMYALTGFTSLPWLHRLTMPTLVIAGDDDPIVPMVNARVLGLMLPRSRFIVLRGAGHWLLLERRSEAARLIDEFLTPQNVRALLHDDSQT